MDWSWSWFFAGLAFGSVVAYLLIRWWVWRWQVGLVRTLKERGDA